MLTSSVLSIKIFLFLITLNNFTQLKFFYFYSFILLFLDFCFFIKSLAFWYTKFWHKIYFKCPCRFFFNFWKNFSSRTVKSDKILISFFFRERLKSINFDNDNNLRQDVIINFRQESQIRYLFWKNVIWQFQFWQF